jgi:hypothetical protein
LKIKVRYRRSGLFSTFNSRDEERVEVRGEIDNSDLISWGREMVGVSAVSDIW